MNQVPTPQGMTRAQAMRAKRQQGTTWMTPSGMEVVVRELDIADHAVINQLPNDLQQIVYRVIERDAKLRGPLSEEEENPFAGLSGKELIQREYEIGRELCKIGWIDPEVVDVVTNEATQISVDELDPRDRRAYMARIFGQQQQEAQQLATFPGEPAGGVGPGPAVPTVQPAPESGPRPDAAVLRYDSV